MNTETAEQLAQRLKAKLRCDSWEEVLSCITAIWICGACDRLARLGVFEGVEITLPEGIEEWQNIDNLRHEPISSRLLGAGIAHFTEGAEEEMRREVAEVYGLHFLDAPRKRIIRASLESLYQSSSTKDQDQPSN